MKGKLSILLLLLTIFCMGFSLVPAAHAAVTVNAGHTTYNSGGSKADHVVTAPSHSPGDSIYLAVACDGVRTIVWPSGFAAIYYDDIEGTATWGLAWKLAGASEPATYTFSIASERAVAICWSQSDDDGVDDTSSVNGGSGAVATCNAAETSVANDLILRIVATDSSPDDPPGVTHSTITDYTMLDQENLYSGASLSVQYITQASIGSTGTAAVTITSEQWGSGTVAIKPASSGPTTYTINAMSGPGGSISPSGDVTVAAGTNQTFDITPSGGSVVSDVLVDGSSVGAVTTYTFNNVTQNHTIVANFSAVPSHTITATAGVGGSIDPSGAVTVNEGGNQGFDITPDTGSTILDVVVDSVSQGAIGSYTFTNVTQDHTIHATFEAVPTHTITATAGNNGSISPSGAVVVTEGDDQPFTMTPDVGYSVLDVLVDTASVGSTENYTFSEVDSDHTIEVSFVEGGIYTIIATAGSGGTISPSGTITVEENGSQTFTITPNAGNSVLDVEVNGESIEWSEGQTTYTFSNVTQSYTIVAYFNVAADACVDLASVPVGSMIHTAPANIMFVIDDSSSMGWETFTRTHDKGWFKGRYTIFHTPGEWSRVALIGDPADDSESRQIDLRMYWKSQWAPHTHMYYDPSYTYQRWPNKPDADPDTPKLDPMGSSTRDMSATFVSFDNGGTIIDIPYAHYYVLSATDEMPYLVIIDGGQITYYVVSTTGDGEDQVVTALTLTGSPPADVQSTRSYDAERQNFANYFTFYRKRIYAAKAAVGTVIASMEGVKAGLYTIHGEEAQTVVPIKCEGEDQTDYLLGVLYDFGGESGTPLRGGLQGVGRYFDKHDGYKLDGSSGDDSPWASADDGGECQQAFAIVMTDGHWDTDDSGYVNRGDEDGDNNTLFDGPPYADDHNQGNTLADMAMYYYERDLNNDLDNKVPTNPADSAPHQHMVTYTVSFGVIGTLDPDDYDEYLINKTTGVAVQWPEVNFGDDDDTKIDDMWHAAVNGRGIYLNAGNPGELVSALVDIMQNLVSRVGSASSVSVSGDDLYGTLDEDTVMFQTTYSPGSWAGDVKAYDVNPTTGEVLMDLPIWSASEKLDNKQWTTRVIATYNPDNDTGIKFAYSSLTGPQQALLDSDPDIVDYLSGKRDPLEVQYGGAFRNRSTVLGDIVHSSPVFQEDASGNGYLYVGANDGMMHCLNAATGQEVFAYVPNLVFENLAWYTNPDYMSDHKYYVDLSPVVTPNVDAGMGSTMTVLVGGLGKGGKGYYALDVTNPASMSTGAAVAGQVLWEYGGDDFWGYTYSKPTIVNSKIASNSKGTGWIVITGNGYASVNGTAVLFILDPFDGTVLRKIDVLNGPCNGLSTPAAIDTDSDGKVNYVYAGDLKGNLWKFDLTDDQAYANWDVAYKDGGIPKPLFQAPGQPITTQPDVMKHCDKFGYMVIFGTGKFLGASDLIDESLQSIFGIWDYGDDDDNTEYLGTFTRGATPQLSNQPDTVSLLRQTYVPSGESDPMFWIVGVGDNKLRILTANVPDWTTTTFEENGSTCTGAGEGTDACDRNNTGDNPDPVANVGWYFDLPLTGERVVSDVMIRENKVIVLSYTAEGDPCGAGGTTIIHEIDACTGGRLNAAQFDIDDSGTIGTADMINIGIEEDLYVAPSGLLRDGRLQPPAILSLGNQAGLEMKYYGGSGDEIPGEIGLEVTQGIAHWRVYR